MHYMFDHLSSPPTQISQLTIARASTYYPHSRHYSVTITGLLVTVFLAGHPWFGDARATCSSWSQLRSLLECLHVHAPFHDSTLSTASSWNHHLSAQTISFWLRSLLYYSLRVPTSFCLDMYTFLHASLLAYAFYAWWVHFQQSGNIFDYVGVGSRSRSRSRSRSWGIYFSNGLRWDTGSKRVGIGCSFSFRIRCQISMDYIDISWKPNIQISMGYIDISWEYQI